MADPRPYVNYALLQQNIGRSVCAIGKVSEVATSGMEITLKLADNRDVKVKLEEQLQEMLEGYVQVVARVNRDCSLTAEHLVSFGQGDMDLNILNCAIEATAKHSNLFNASEVNGQVF